MSDRSLIGRMGAYGQHAKHDPKVTTMSARRNFRERFVQQVDPDLKLSPEERQRRAEAAMRLHMNRLSLKSAKARRKGGA